MNLDLDLALKAALEAAIASRKVLQIYYGRLVKISEKDRAGLVSEADVESEKACWQVLKTYFPDFRMLGEEGTDSTNQNILDEDQGVWIVDPLDGTTNYIHQFPFFSISIALYFEKRLQIGLVDAPMLNKTYYAVRGKGAFYDGGIDKVSGVRLAVSKRQGVENALMSTGFNAYDKNALKSQIAIFSELVGRSRGIRRAGSAALDLCFVAEGVFDAYWETSLQPWDMAAGALIVAEAGGQVTNEKGEPYTVSSKSIVAGNTHIHSEVISAIKKSCQNL